MTLFAARACLFAGLVCAAAPHPARAATRLAAAEQDQAALSAERLRLRAELDRINAEIDALKRAPAGFGDDGRLRARMADAESLARRLIAIEARLGLRAPAARPAPLPVAAPTDGPADLDAKADILADQSRRVQQEADRLGRRVAELKSRQDLRRRAADLDRDPFAPMEGSKRRVAAVAASDGGSHALAPTSSNDRGTPSTPSTSPVLSPASGGGQTAVGATAAPGGGAPIPATPISSPAATTLSLELRDLLDPATVADIRRLEGTKTPATSVAALERAVAALRARAAALDARARAFRTAAGASAAAGQK